MGENAFALAVQDDSMSPELKVGDVLIVDPDQSIRPGGLVIACKPDDRDVIVRRYRQLSAAYPIQEYELIPVNENWANIRVSQTCEYKIVGTVLVAIRLM